MNTIRSDIKLAATLTTIILVAFGGWYMTSLETEHNEVAAKAYYELRLNNK